MSVKNAAISVWKDSIRDRESETLGDGMCSCFYLRLSKHLLGGLGTRLADEVADMIVRIKRGLSTCCYSQPPEPPGNTERLNNALFDGLSASAPIRCRTIVVQCEDVALIEHLFSLRSPKVVEPRPADGNRFRKLIFSHQFSIKIAE